MQSVSKVDSKREEGRLQVLRKYEILDTPPDARFDKITKLAAHLLRTPIAIVSLVDKDRIWFKSKFGIDVHEIPRESGFCSSAILSDSIYVVEDAKNDPRTMANSLVVGEKAFKFYGAVPLKTNEGFNLGTLCVIDYKPRSLTETEKEVLIGLGELVMNQIELQLEKRIAVRHYHQLLNTTAHDLKNPVSIMPLLADLIMENKANPAAIDDISKQIKDAGRRMALTINELLENAMSETDGLHLRLESFDLKLLVQGIVSANTALAKRKNQELILEKAQSCIVFADHRRLTEVVDNVINNAIKYSFDNTKIIVRLKKTKGEAIIEVHDEGLGLTKDDLNNLFRRFTSLSAQPTGGEISTGLGLSMAKEIVEAHRGTITAESAGKKRGSIFRIALPLAEEQVLTS